MTRLGPGAEFDLIRRFLAADLPARMPDDVMVGPGDDAAVVSAHPLALSTDLSIEGIHFQRDWLTPEEIGWRAATAAFSDLAAMIARPVGILLSIAANNDDVSEFAVRVVAGASEAARAVDARLIGGDLTRSPGPLVIDAVVAGEVSHPLRRDGARPGDEVWVTGRLGGSAAALNAWLRGDRPSPSARARFARPRARVREALWLRQHVDMTAGIDLSDGLAGDLPHLAAASAVGIIVDPDAIPVHEDADPTLALTGGEEYELAVVAPRDAMRNVAAAFEAEFGLPLTNIGRVIESDRAEVRLRGADGATRPLPPPSYRHFD